MDQMTAKEKLVVEELRSRTINDVSPKMLEDVALFYRFAKARNFNLKDAETMLRNHISWRKEMGVDTILTEYKLPEIFLKYVPTNCVCFDKEGGIVRHQDCGRADVIGFWSMASKTDWEKFLAYNLEQDMDRIIKRGGNLGKPMYTSVNDLEGLTYANAMSVKVLQYVLHICNVLADNYPEVIKTMTIINAPSYFAWLYAALSPLFPSTIIQKIGVYGKGGWREVLLEKIDANVLPAFLGGNKTDPDGNPLCKTFMKFGQPVPKNYYMQNMTKKLSLESDVKKLTVKPLSKEEIAFEVKEENSYLEWEFQTKSRDIDFILLFRRETMETVELIPKQRIESSDEPEKGSFKCEKVGYYAIVFDNSYSWLHSKEVSYRAEIKYPKNKDLKARYISSLS